MNIKITEQSTLSPSEKNQLFLLWNKEYPESLSYRDMTEFDSYMNHLNQLKHLLLHDDQDHIMGWAFSFDRENERWFALILSEKCQKKGLGKQMLEQIKSTEKELNGWVIDHNMAVKPDGSTYESPLGFYQKCGFKIVEEQRLELDKISAAKIKWTAEFKQST